MDLALFWRCLELALFCIGQLLFFNALFEMNSGNSNKAINMTSTGLENAGPNAGLENAGPDAGLENAGLENAGLNAGLNEVPNACALLFAAAQRGHADIVARMLRVWPCPAGSLVLYGGSVREQRNPNFQVLDRAFAIAVQNDFADTVDAFFGAAHLKHIWASDETFSKHDGYYYSPLHYAAKAGSARAAQVIIGHMETEAHRKNVRGIQSNEEFWFRAYSKVSLSSVGIVNSSRVSAMLPLWRAASYGHANVIRVLVDAKAELGLHNDRSPLICAAGAWSVACVCALVRLKADVRQKTHRGCSALFFAQMHYEGGVGKTTNGRTCTGDATVRALRRIAEVQQQRQIQQQIQQIHQQRQQIQIQQQLQQQQQIQQHQQIQYSAQGETP
jgi:hypothetical protein